MRRILILLPINWIILSVRMWIADHIFRWQGKKKLLRVSIIVGILAAGGLFAYPYLLDLIGQTQIDYTELANYPTRLIPLALAIYAIILVYIDTLLVRRFTPTLRITKHLLVLIGSIVLTYLLLGMFSVSHIILYYLLVAGSEEILKYLGGMTFFEKHHLSSTDLLLFAFLTSLGFAFFENIIYLFHTFDSNSGRIRQLVGGTSIIVTRGIVGFIVHLLFTGLIAYLAARAIRHQKSLFRILLAFLLGVLLHLSYNLLLHWNISIVIVFYVLIGYGLLSWLFYRSDSLYLK